MYIKKKHVSDLHSIDHLNNCFSRSTISFCGFRKMFKWLMKSSATLSISVQKSRTSFIFNIFLEATERTLYHSEPCLGRRHFRETSDRNVLCFSFYKRTVSFIFLFWIKYNIRFYGQTNVLKVGKQHTGLLGFKLRLLTVSNIEVSGPYLAVFWLYPPRNK